MVNSEAFPPALVRPLAPGDEAAWRTLWAGYLAFYRQALAPEVTEGLWRRLTVEARADLLGRVAVCDGQAVGLLHAVLHANTWSLAPVCYLEDLYVAPAMRGRGIGAALIESLAAEARAEGWRRIYWRTAAGNATAQALYERLARRTGWVTYELDPAEPGASARGWD